MADGDIAPASSDNDHWRVAIYLFTGIMPPARGTVFKDLYGNDGIPLMTVEINDSSPVPSIAKLEAINDLSWRTQNSGWRIEKTDFTVPFYSGVNRAVGALPVGSEVKMRKARITLLGTDTVHDVPAGGVDMGGRFGAGSRLMQEGFKGWDSRPLANYSYGSGLALEQLLNPPCDTHGWDNNGANAARAAFLERINQLGIEDRNYADILPFATSQPQADNYLRTAKRKFLKAVMNLHATWSIWAHYRGNPLRWLHDILLDVTDDVWNNNITKVRHKCDSRSGRGSYSGDDHHEVKHDGFRASAGNYGNLDDLATWKAIGEEAIRRWQKCAQDNLGEAAKQALIDAIMHSSTSPRDLHVLTTKNSQLLWP
ncbi:hypothetical protein [Actinoallomurus iriomotensis]|uniref:Uncharacterized protein n=1 Tax=Actinoallomurus iriomotensis TaxID=478107 RepID=A0A9W6W5R4_9ACTN|nr:hypothetical protein [Actinoallomurus iriomotensis]GLY92330.1 hypothetical protein Airi02_102580 [Actinoallomurus iriomotensis]